MYKEELKDNSLVEMRDMPPARTNVPTVEGNSAFIHNNPDFDPSKDVPGARGCDTTAGIISNS
jgi:hypothetical protein